jgi:hypothetical protein
VGVPGMRTAVRDPESGPYLRGPGQPGPALRPGQPAVRATFDAVLAAVLALGPVEVLAEKSRIALQVRMSFAALMPRRHWLNGHLVLPKC